MSVRFRGQDIKSFMPSVDARSVDDVFILDGKNFLFDSKGPKSGFTTELMTPFPFYNPLDIQGIRIQDRTFVFSEDAILAWREHSPFTWELLATFDIVLPLNKQTPWSAIFMDGNLYLSQEGRGFFASPLTNNTLKLDLEAKTNIDIPGLLDNIKGMDVCHGRAVLVNADTIQWSAVSDMTDLSPTLGGAGIQLINNFVKGTFLALSSFEDAFIVWTTSGAILATYIGGDSVWRFDPFISLERPLDAWCTVGISNGNVVLMTRHGVMQVNNGAIPQDWTPDFNEFLRGYLADSTPVTSTWRLDYDIDRQLIFLSESTDGISYWRTFVLSPTLNKWGILSDTIYGCLPFTNELYGYVDAIKLPRYFRESFSRATSPDNALGLSPLMPRVQKQLPTPSSTVVSRTLQVDTTSEFGGIELPIAAWYRVDSLYPQPYGRMGLDSFIQIGYLRTSGAGSDTQNSMSDAVDTIQEINQVEIGSIASAAPTPSDFTTEWKSDYFYSVGDEDWNSVAIIVDGDLTTDFMTTLIAGIDCMSYPIGHNIDHLGYDSRMISFSDDGSEDWNVIGGAEDWGGPVSGLSQLSYQLQIQSTQDGITMDAYIPQLIRFNTKLNLFSTMTVGELHMLRLDASEYMEYYHLQNYGLTFTNAGSLA